MSRRLNGMKDIRARWRARVLFVAAVVITLLVARGVRKARRAASPGGRDDPSLTLVTGYCNCGKCCGWSRDWFGFGEPVYDYGPMKGKPKKVGVTATGKVAKRGTIAADTKVFPFGTRIEVPGYGTGIVEDVGGAINGRHIDIWFPTHAEASKWGARWLKVKSSKSKVQSQKTRIQGRKTKVEG